MSLAGKFPGLIWQYWYQYQPRWPWGQDGMLKVISAVATEDIPPGVMVQATGGTEDAVLVRIARDATRLVGIGAYDPDRYDHQVVYQQGDVFPVVRRGGIFVAFAALVPPFADPAPMAGARFYPGAPGAPQAGWFTTDLAGTVAHKCLFIPGSKDYYQTTSGSPQADVPLDVPPIPLGEMSTTFGDGVALVEVALP